MSDVIAIYTRVSQEDSEEPASTRRQELACRRLAESKGWEVAGVWEDVDVSAYEKGVRRPAFEDLMTAVAGGRLSGVLVWKLDRLVRRNADFERFWTRCERAGVSLSSATEPIDSTTDLGLAVIRILVTFANAESTSIGLRIRSRMEEKARSGDPLTPARAFGLNKTRTKVVEKEAVLIREAAQRFLEEETLGGIVDDWQRRRIATPNGGPWTVHKLSALLQSPRLLGHNTFKGKVVKTDCFPVILDPLTSARIQDRFANTYVRRTPPEKFVLSRLLRCGGCGTRMTGMAIVVAEARRGRGPQRRYKCPSRPSGCHQVSINADFVEALVVGATLERLKRRTTLRPSARPPAGSTKELQSAYERHAESLRLLAHDYYVERRLTREVWESARDGLERELGDARLRFDPSWRPTVSRRPGGSSQFQRDWESLDLSHRRDILASEIEYVTVTPVKGYRGGLDSGRVHPVWRDDDPELAAKAWPVTGNDRVDMWVKERWMNTREAAEALGISMLSVTAMARKGELPTVKHGRHYRYNREVIARAVETYSGRVRSSEVARRLDVKPTRVTNWIRRGKLPAVRRGHYYYVRPEDIDSVGTTLLK
jgi:site-specific DNA recombinase